MAGSAARSVAASPSHRPITSKDTVEAETVELIFRRDRHGDGSSGPLGVEAVPGYLNAGAHRTRAGSRFGVATIPG